MRVPTTHAHPTPRRLLALAATFLTLSTIALPIAAAASTQAVFVATIDGVARIEATSTATDHARLSDARRGRPLSFIDTTLGQRIATPVEFEIEQTRSMRLEILDLDGRVIRTLASGLWAEGNHTLAWHRDDDEGNRVDEGIYMVRLRAADRTPDSDLALRLD